MARGTGSVHARMAAPAPFVAPAVSSAGAVGVAGRPGGAIRRRAITASMLAPVALCTSTLACGFCTAYRVLLRDALRPLGCSAAVVGAMAHHMGPPGKLRDAVARTVLLEADRGMTVRGLRMDDCEILRNLASVRGWRRQDMGAKGNCLFLSVATQVEPTDVEALSQRSEMWMDMLGPKIRASWRKKSVPTRARFLRRIAVKDELEWIQRVREAWRDEPMPEADVFRTRELFMDMVEEFAREGCGTGGLPQLPPSCSKEKIYEVVREFKRGKTFEEEFEFVQMHMERYLEKTGHEGNWAGSSELVALSHALQRPVEAYGNNWLSQPTVQVLLSENGTRCQVLPYLAARPTEHGVESHSPVSSAASSEEGSQPIRVFQTNGGGHYQMLTSR